MDRDFQKVKLTKEQEIFLNGYEPEDPMVTSIEEIKMISDKLDLNNANAEHLTAIRNTAVAFYSDLVNKIREETGSFSDYAYNKWVAMQSVTAIIDHYKNRYGLEV